MRYVAASDVRLKKRKGSSHKGENGKVLVVAGSEDYVGAAYLSGMAAFRSGADYVMVAAPEKVAWAINCLSPDFVTKKFKGEFFTTGAVRKVVKLSREFDVVLVGNGLGRSVKTLKFAAAVCKAVGGLKVVDADAIAAVRLQDVRNAVFTPHAAECRLLLRNSGIEDRIGKVRKAIGSNVIIVKGKTDRIISREKVAYNRTGNAGMTVAGTGDVLAGAAAGILAQERDMFRAACAAAYFSGKAGSELFKRSGYGFTASDVLDALPSVIFNVKRNP